jgi:hypothetical protein
MIVTGNDVDLELRQISENLHRSDLTKLERDEQVARWIDLTAAKQAEVSDKLSETPNKGGRPGKATAAARELGIHERDAQRAIKVASISDEAKEAAVDAGLADNRSALLTVAKESTPEAQVAKVGEISSAKVEAKTRKAEVITTPSEDKRLDAAELEGMARAICVGLSALDPIVDKIHEIGAEEFLRQINTSARAELWAVLDDLWRLNSIYDLARKLARKGKLDFGDDDVVESSAAPDKPETETTATAADDSHLDIPGPLRREPAPAAEVVPQ